MSLKPGPSQSSAVPGDDRAARGSGLRREPGTSVPVGIRGAVPCTDSANPNRTVVSAWSRVDSRQSDGAETITWVPVIEEITAWRVFRGVSPAERAWWRCGSTIGYQSATHECLSPAADWPPSQTIPPGCTRQSGGDGQFHDLHSYRHGPPVGRRHVQRAVWPGNARGVGPIAANDALPAGR